LAAKWGKQKKEMGEKFRHERVNTFFSVCEGGVRLLDFPYALDKNTVVKNK
jgi:hypothetical protein